MTTVTARGRSAHARRPQLALVGALLVLAGVAWWLSAREMAGMSAVPGMELGAVGFYMWLWVVMIATGTRLVLRG
jgi:hypothetical protein